jgi:hypothetical protein
MDTICSKSERLLKSADSPVSLESDFTVDDTHGRFATMSSPFDGYIQLRTRGVPIVLHSLARKLEYARSYQVFSAWPAISSVIALGRLVWFRDILYVGVSTLELARIRYKYALN